MSLIPYKYWREYRLATTSNSQFPTVAPKILSKQATRTDTDVYLRSVFSAQLAITSDGSNAVWGWWGQAQVRLVVSWDPSNAGTPSDIGDNDPFTLGYRQMNPRRFQLSTGDGYEVVWTTGDTPLVLTTARDGLGGGIKPAVIASLWYYDQNGFFGRSAESSIIERCQITGRVLWGSTSAV